MTQIAIFKTIPCSFDTILLSKLGRCDGCNSAIPPIQPIPYWNSLFNFTIPTSIISEIFQENSNKLKSIQIDRFQLIFLLIPSFKPWLNISCSWISWFPYIQSSRNDPICYHIKNHLTPLSHDDAISFDFFDPLKAWLYPILFVYLLFNLDPLM